MTSFNCPFCMPNVQKTVFAESENFLAVYNIAPILPGHSLIIPKEHISRFMQASDELMTEMVIFSRKVIRILSIAFKTESFDWTLQEGTAAGQTVGHMHIHIIPRIENDLPDPGDWYPQLKKAETEIIDSLARPRFSDAEIQTIVHYLRNLG